MIEGFFFCNWHLPQSTLFLSASLHHTCLRICESQYIARKTLQSKRISCTKVALEVLLENVYENKKNRGIKKVWPLRIMSELSLCFVEIDIQPKRLELDNHWTGEFVWSSNKYMGDCNWVRWKICLIHYAVETVSTKHT